MNTTRCAKCGKAPLALGRDGACKRCGAGLCWECWLAAGRECPACGRFDADRAANSDKGAER